MTSFPGIPDNFHRLAFYWRTRKIFYKFTQHYLFFRKFIKFDKVVVTRKWFIPSVINCSCSSSWRLIEEVLNMTQEGKPNILSRFLHHAGCQEVFHVSFIINPYRYYVKFTPACSRSNVWYESISSRQISTWFTLRKGQCRENSAFQLSFSLHIINSTCELQSVTIT